jgi:hypothetical protein
MEKRLRGYLQTRLAAGLSMLLLCHTLATQAQEFKPPSAGAIKLPRIPYSFRQGVGDGKPCAIAPIPLTLIVPQSNPVLSVSETPLLFLFAPQTQPPGLVELILQDERDQVLYTATAQLTNQTGVVSLRLPRPVTKLMKIGDNYRFRVSLVCSNQPSSKPLTAFVSEVWMQRTTPTPELTKALQGKQPRQQAAVYATFGLWENAATILADLRQRQPGDQFVLKDWQLLLKSVGLADFAQQRVLNCCQQRGVVNP